VFFSTGEHTGNESDGEVFRSQTVESQGRSHQQCSPACVERTRRPPLSTLHTSHTPGSATNNCTPFGEEAPCVFPLVPAEKETATLLLSISVCWKTRPLLYSRVQSSMAQCAIQCMALVISNQQLVSAVLLMNYGTIFAHVTSRAKQCHSQNNDNCSVKDLLPCYS
jgi:hypothetical protein